MVIRMKKLKENAILPVRSHENDAGADLFACIENEVVIKPHKTVKIPTGIAVQVPVGYYGAIYPRSGLSSKYGIRPANCVGVCDCGYTGEYIVALHNDSEFPYTVKPNDKIAQLVISPYAKTDFVFVDEIDETDRGAGGFGSTGR